MASSKVLISEVEPGVRQLLVALLERLGHETIVLRADIVVPPRADLLFVDPLARTGLEQARLVRAFFPEMPIVCLNGLPDNAGFLGRGPTVFLAPDALEELLGHIASLATI
jgi:hypothetical protein